MDSRLIAIGHRKQQGKDTLAKFIKGLDDFTSRSFAEPLKTLAREAFGLSWRQVDGTDAEKNTMTRVTAYHLGGDLNSEESEILTARQVLQRLGVRMREHFPKIWVNAPFRARGAEENTLITDLRFPDEFDRVVEEGGVTVRVTRPGHDLGDAHVSETALDDHEFDIEVINDGAEEDLRWAAAMVYALSDGPLEQRIELSCKSRLVKVLG